MAQPRLIECIDFDRPAGGSFIPMVRALLTEARSRGWSSEALVPHTAAAVPWLDDLRNDGVKVHVAPDEGDLKLGKWLGEIVDAGSPHALLHSHFHGFDEAGWLVARTRPHLALIWHVHSTFSRGPTRIARAMLKLGVMGRRVDAILCPADNICAVDYPAGRAARAGPLRAERDRRRELPSGRTAAANRGEEIPRPGPRATDHRALRLALAP